MCPANPLPVEHYGRGDRRPQAHRFADLTRFRDNVTALAEWQAKYDRLPLEVQHRWDPATAVVRDRPDLTP